MKDEVAARAAQLLRNCRVAALGTIHEGAPLVSMTPFALMPAPLAFVVLVSGLSAHTRDMLSDPRVSLLVMEPERADAGVHATARLTAQGESRPIAPSDARYVAARAAYEARFPDMRGLFDLGDFGLFGIAPASVRVIGGFAQAHSISPASLEAALVSTP